MSKILLAFDDVGLGVQLQESLERRGHQVQWDAAQASGPSSTGVHDHEAVLLFVDGSSKLESLIEQWLAIDPRPAVIAMGSDLSLEPRVTAARATFVPSAADVSELEAAMATSIKLRFATGLSVRMAARALGLPPGANPDHEAARILGQAREADHEIVKEALRHYPQHYIGLNPLVSQLRESRVLTIPEVDLARKLNGTITLQTALRAGPLDIWQAARFIWALASVGAASFTVEPPDQSTPGRRAVWHTRHNLRARKERLATMTFYDVLEVTATAEPPEIDHACSQLAIRYQPQRIGALDLGVVQPLVEECWDQIRRARSVLIDPADRGRYNDWCRGRASEITTEWATSKINPRGALDAFNRGQRALVEGEVHRAVSEMAAACRSQPGHPNYEASLAWAQYRSDVTKGKDRDETAAKYRAVAEKALAGRRPWPHGLLALGMLCAAAGDPDPARWHLHQALAVDPQLPAAQKLLQRLGQ